MSEAASKGGLSRFSISRSNKQTDRKLLINSEQGLPFNQSLNYITREIENRFNILYKTSFYYILIIAAIKRCLILL